MALLFKNGHVHTVIKFRQYFPIGYQHAQDMYIQN